MATQVISCLLLIGALNLVFFISTVYGCASCGVPTCQGLSGCGIQPVSTCGGGCGCGGCPPPQPVIQPSCCAPSVGCGGFGGCGRKKREAVRRRGGSRGPVRFIRETTPTNMFSDNPANEKFMQCCAGRGLPAACMQHCTFQTYDRNLLSRMFFKIDQCPIELAADIHFCAAQGKDHSQCCVAQGVGMTLGGQRCLIFCNQLPGYVTPLDLTYMPCYDRFDAMKDCFYSSILSDVGKK